MTWEDSARKQLCQQTFEPACVPTSFHTHSYLSASTREITIELLRLFAMCQTLFLKFSGVGIHRSYLLRPGVKIHSYNDHCSAPFSEPVGWFLAPPTLLGPGSRHCHGINYTQNAKSGWCPWRVEQNWGT